jgi:Na+/H+ antiporter NhaA
MTRSQDLTLLLLAPICSLAFVGLLFLHRNRVYTIWAKIASILALLAGSGWGILGVVLMDWRSHHLTRHSYYTFVGLQGLLGGIAVGFTLSILIARPYVKTQTETRSV